MNAHPVCAAWPDMAAEEYAALLESIREVGLLHPIVTLDGTILDGRHRYRACKQLGVEPAFVEYQGDDPVGFVAGQHTRRNLTFDQRAVVAAKMAALPRGRPTEKPFIKGFSAQQAAQAVGVSTSSVEKAKRVLVARPEVEDALLQGRTTLAEQSKSISVERAAARAAEARQRREQRIHAGVEGALPPEEQAAFERQLEDQRREALLVQYGQALNSVRNFPARLTLMVREFIDELPLALSAMESTGGRLDVETIRAATQRLCEELDRLERTTDVEISETTPHLTVESERLASEG